MRLHVPWPRLWKRVIIVLARWINSTFLRACLEMLRAGQILFFFFSFYKNYRLFRSYLISRINSTWIDIREDIRRVYTVISYFVSSKLDSSSLKMEIECISWIWDMKVGEWYHGWEYDNNLFVAFVGFVFCHHSYKFFEIDRVEFSSKYIYIYISYNNFSPIFELLPNFYSISISYDDNLYDNLCYYNLLLRVCPTLP